ncbi:MAG: Ldh family oxidoreductase, partial [SAR324 cluster bacterium]|nr:Ldh family oxidoreductase [SAR324 cluster bacterium]
ILDFATSLVAEGKALVALRGGTPLPEGAIIEPDGKLGNDPLPLYGEIPEDRYPDPNVGPGALTGFGLHKGAGLNFFMEMFAGALTGSGTSAGIQDTSLRRFCNGMLSVYFSLDYFHSDDWFAQEVRNYIEFYKDSRPAKPDGEVLIPGEVELRLMKERMNTGLPLSQTSWKDLTQKAEKIGVSRKLVDQAGNFFIPN